MTPEQRATLMKLASKAMVAEDRSGLKQNEEALVAYVDSLCASNPGASITTPEGQRDYYRDLFAMARDENIRLTRDLAEYEAYDALPETKPLLSDYIVGWGTDSGAVFIRHTSEIMFKITPFEKDGDKYFKLTQYGDNEEIAKEMYLCIGEMEGLHELLADTRNQAAAMHDPHTIDQAGDKGGA
jgi:hypothetical protein